MQPIEQTPIQGKKKSPELLLSIRQHQDDEQQRDEQQREEQGNSQQKGQEGQQEGQGQEEQALTSLTPLAPGLSRSQWTPQAPGLSRSQFRFTDQQEEQEEEQEERKGPTPPPNAQLESQLMNTQNRTDMNDDQVMDFRLVRQSHEAPGHRALQGELLSEEFNRCDRLQESLNRSNALLNKRQQLTPHQLLPQEDIYPRRNKTKAAIKPVRAYGPNDSHHKTSRDFILSEAEAREQNMLPVIRTVNLSSQRSGPTRAFTSYTNTTGQEQEEEEATSSRQQTLLPTLKNNSFIQQSQGMRSDSVSSHEHKVKLFAVPKGRQPQQHLLADHGSLLIEQQLTEAYAAREFHLHRNRPAFSISFTFDSTSNWRTASSSGSICRLFDFRTLAYSSAHDSFMMVFAVEHSDDSVDQSKNRTFVEHDMEIAEEEEEYDEDEIPMRRPKALRKLNRTGMVARDRDLNDEDQVLGINTDGTWGMNELSVDEVIAQVAFV